MVFLHEVMKNQLTRRSKKTFLQSKNGFIIEQNNYESGDILFPSLHRQCQYCQITPSGSKRLLYAIVSMLENASSQSTTAVIFSPNKHHTISIATVQQSWMMVGVKEVSGHSYCLLHLQKKTLGISDHKQIKRRFNLYLQDNCKGHSYWFTYQSQLASLQEKIFGTGQILMLECQLAIASSVSQHQLSLATSYR